MKRQKQNLSVLLNPNTINHEACSRYFEMLTLPLGFVYFSEKNMYLLAGIIYYYKER